MPKTQKKQAEGSASEEEEVVHGKNILLLLCFVIVFIVVFLTAHWPMELNFMLQFRFTSRRDDNC